MASGSNPSGRSRFAKLGMAINEELTQACRDVLEMEVPPGLVYSKVKTSLIYKNIRPEQELRLIGAKTDGYKRFDITLLYTLIRNICTKISIPTKGWGGNTLPSAGETTIGDDIERIRMIRNNMFGHISSASTSQTDFDDAWSIITDICQRLQTYTKKDYMSCLSNIQSQALEEEYEITLIEKFKEDYKNNQSLMEKMSSLEQSFVKLKTKYENKENPLVKAILDNWREDDIAFIPTRASKAVEEKIESLNLIMVVGNSGSGKSAIIQHIALKYNKMQGWNVIPVDKVEEIKIICSTEVSEYQILFVFNDPLGKESLDEILYHSWKGLEKTLEICLKKNKLLISCRRCVFYDKRVKGVLVDEFAAVEIDNETNGLTVKEKRAIFNQYSHNLHLSEKFITEIIKTEAYFPLLCKLFSRDPNYNEKGINFFKHPYRFIKEEIEMWKKSDKKKFCSLILIVAFKNNLKIDAIVKNENSFMKFKGILGMCELQENTHISVIRSTLHDLKGSYVKLVGNNFQFLHDFITEITTLVFGVDCPQETIQYADSGFLKRRVKLEDETEEEDRDPFTVYLPEEYIEDLVDRFIIDMQTKNLADVLLNPCLRNKTVAEEIKKKLDSSENIPKLTLNVKCEIDRLEFGISDNSSFSRLDFLESRDTVCPLCGFIVFCHDDISKAILRKVNYGSVHESSIFSAVCANGDVTLLDSLREQYKISSIKETWSTLYPIHIASVFHNFAIIPVLLKLGADINMLSTDGRITPLFAAAGNEEESREEVGRKNEEGKRRDKTVLCLLNEGADVNLCGNNGYSPLCIACQNGYDSTIQLLLEKGADINLCAKDNYSPLYLASRNRHYSTVQLLLNNGADINLYDKNGASPLHIACYDGHDTSVQLLLNKGADPNLCNNKGISPLHLACDKGNDRKVQMLLKKGANVNLSYQNGHSSLFIACQKGYERIVKLLLNNGAIVNLYIPVQEGDYNPKTEQDSAEKHNLHGISPLWIACCNGHECTVQLLLNKGAEINSCDNNKTSPLSIACENGREKIVQLLLKNGANIHLCDDKGASPLWIACKRGYLSIVQLLLTSNPNIDLGDRDGASPLFTACRQGHESIAQLLLNNGADINLCRKDHFSPLFIASSNGYDNLVQLLLNKNANVNLCDNNGASPLGIACHRGYLNIVQLLLSNSANIDVGIDYGVSPLYIACHEGRESIAKLLLSNGADVNLCREGNYSPLYIACQNGYDSLVQLLLNYNADINLCDINGISPLSAACLKGNESTVQLLLNCSADINLCGDDGYNPLYIACREGNDKIVKLLLDNGADANIFKKGKSTPLFEACLFGHPQTVQYLLDKGADINFQYDGGSPLYVACQEGYDNIVQLLLNNGADINLCNTNEESPFHIAIQQGHDSTAQLLLNNGVDVNVCKKNNYRPLHLACQEGHVSTVQLLINNGADVNLSDSDNVSPLLIACQKGNDSIIKLLLNNKADPNLCRKDNASPLHIACQNGYNSIVNILLTKGADINVSAKNGFSPLHSACQKGHDSTVQLLLNNGADVNSCNISNYLQVLSLMKMDNTANCICYSMIELILL